jgi:hypothetical protein
MMFSLAHFGFRQYRRDLDAPERRPVGLFMSARARIQGAPG